MARVEGAKITGSGKCVYRKTKGGSVTHGLRHEGTALFPLTRRECRTLIHWWQADGRKLPEYCAYQYAWAMPATRVHNIRGFFGFGYHLLHKTVDSSPFTLRSFKFVRVLWIIDAVYLESCESITCKNVIKRFAYLKQILFTQKFSCNPKNPYLSVMFTYVLINR